LQVGRTVLFLGVDGGGTGCRARLADRAGTVLGEGTAGPANIRVNLDESIHSVLAATRQCLDEAGVSFSDSIIACLALAGASEPREAAAARAALKDRFRHVIVTTDAHAACAGAHAGRNGGIIIVGTGSIGWAVESERSFRVGGWGFPVSDEGGGAWLGCEAVRRALWAHDGRLLWTPLLRAIAAEFDLNPHAIVAWMGTAKPRDFGRLAPYVVEHAATGDPVAQEIMHSAACHIDAIAARLGDHGAARLSLMGGLANAIEPWLAGETRSRLVPPAGDALDGALRIARASRAAVRDPVQGAPAP
jgi:glucosamine kinase